jgi:hypothetical protein
VGVLSSGVAHGMQSQSADNLEVAMKIKTRVKSGDQWSTRDNPSRFGGPMKVS